eukprot:3411157-Rhodomonas_salina.2
MGEWVDGRMSETERASEQGLPFKPGTLSLSATHPLLSVSCSTELVPAHLPYYHRPALCSSHGALRKPAEQSLGFSGKL